MHMPVCCGRQYYWPSVPRCGMLIIWRPPRLICFCPRCGPLVDDGLCAAWWLLWVLPRWYVFWSGVFWSGVFCLGVTEWMESLGLACTTTGLDFPAGDSEPCRVYTCLWVCTRCETTLGSECWRPFQRKAPRQHSTRHTHPK